MTTAGLVLTYAGVLWSARAWSAAMRLLTRPVSDRRAAALAVIRVGVGYETIAAGTALAGLVVGAALVAGMGLALIVLALQDMWRNRRRRRAVKLIGEKARAIRARLVRTMRQRARPRPVMRPGRLPA